MSKPINISITKRPKNTYLYFRHLSLFGDGGKMSGFLDITINDRNQGDPIAGAKIIVTEHKAENKIVKIAETDSSGQVNYIELDSGERRVETVGYKKYDLIVQIPPIPNRYSQSQEYIKSGIQIWNNRITNNQDELVQIRALEKMNFERRNQVIELPDNSISQPEPPRVYQDPLKIPDSSGFQEEAFTLIKEPFIPTEIDIYLGTANPYKYNPEIISSRVLTENYKKYLKMVSAQEFGGIPKLTEQAEIALFLLVNSFALNRVYTEMYRSTGYPFNITNSTSFDIHYPPGGTTFENINNVVDNHFKKYIRLKGANQPLLSQFCAGKSGYCKNKGIPQLTLNDYSRKNPNKSYRELLMYFYNQMGFEFDIVEAEVVEGNPRSYPGYILKQGMIDPNVSIVQEILLLIRSKYSKIPLVDANGELDEKTYSAVKKFQEIFEKNKRVKGEVDEATWYRLSEKYIEVSGIVRSRETFLHAFYLPV